MGKRHAIFVTNDDGIDSPGFLAALEGACPLGEVLAVAPVRQQTSMGRARTGRPDACLEPRLLRILGAEFTAYALDASPAGVVGHALRVVPDYRPALLIAGINYGENIGVNVTGSGTVGACLEAAAHGIPALAVSLETPVEAHRAYVELDWAAAIHFLRYFASVVLDKGLPPGVQILKVEVPAAATPETPWRMAALSRRLYYMTAIPNAGLQSPYGSRIVAKRDCGADAPGTDSYVLNVDKEVAVTPMTVDLTAYAGMEDAQYWFRNGSSA